MSKYKADDEMSLRAYTEALCYCVKYNLTIRDFAKRLDCGKSLIYAWANGRSTPSGHILRRLALLDVDVMYILTGKRKENSNG